MLLHKSYNLTMPISTFNLVFSKHDGKDILIEIRDILKGRDPRSVIAEQRGMTRE